MGGYDKSGIDCSGFVHKIYTENFHMDELPRTVLGLTRMDRGWIVANRYEETSNLKTGDLVAFRQGWPNYPYHIGIYLGDGEFMHVSKSRGVRISRTDNPYHWRKYFWKARRVLTDDEIRHIVASKTKLRR